MIVLQAIIDGLSVTLRALADGAGDGLLVEAVDLLDVPAGGLEALLVVLRGRERRRPSIEMPLLSNSTISRPRPRWPPA
jgi:hypothetical protein